MRATSKLLALALTAALQPAIAGVVPLTFEDISLAETDEGYLELKSRYAKDGIEFSGAAWGLIASGACGGSSKFTPRSGCNALALNDGDSFTLKFSKGFIAGTSLYYSALQDGIKIALYESENGTGDPTMTFGLTETACGGGARFCNWNLLTLSFSGIARSMVVTGTDQSLMMDDFSFVPAAWTDPGRLPEPASLVLAFSALGALGWARKRAAR